MSFYSGNYIVGYCPTKACTCRNIKKKKDGRDRGFSLHTIFERLDDSSAFRRVLKITNLKEISSIVKKAKERQKPFCEAW